MVLESKQDRLVVKEEAKCESEKEALKEVRRSSACVVVGWRRRCGLTGGGVLAWV